LKIKVNSHFKNYRGAAGPKRGAKEYIGLYFLDKGSLGLEF